MLILEEKEVDPHMKTALHTMYWHLLLNYRIRQRYFFSINKK